MNQRRRWGLSAAKRWAFSVLLSPISNALLDPAKLMYLDEKTPRAEDSWLPLDREPVGRS